MFNGDNIMSNQIYMGNTAMSPIWVKDTIQLWKDQCSKGILGVAYSARVWYIHWVEACRFYMIGALLDLTENFPHFFLLYNNNEARRRHFGP